MRALETRVHGLELAMDEISYDLAVSNGRMSNGSSRHNCCLIPPGSFIRSKFWKKPDQQYSASMLATHRRNMIAQTMGMQDSRQRFNGAAGFIVNPLAETRPDHGSAGYTSFVIFSSSVCLVYNMTKNTCLIVLQVFLTIKRKKRKQKTFKDSLRLRNHCVCENVVIHTYYQVIYITTTTTLSFQPF